ncbi:MAG: hypothetical protein M3119_04615 [Verrucomicrobiota bacterium]|nr:hypothetical protein [Verrucomicrobiota bacterium]MDQ6939421.1 hypothetical protein [Verrucomicrobiota bacterium]
MSTSSYSRKIIATVVVLAVLLAIWKFIDYRTQPPPPPHPVGEIQPNER